ncbi:LysR substrate-binding domain-containing protein [Sodalis sp. RH21]|uniref:LysR substrate-binding domain-containing protein n=1 Tax=unclassified Sodalis (in: enterobacteria) TaxID=2636512 RepID=UPI0039B52706
MNSASLNVFKAVADTGSIAAAARRLHCVSSNVTTRLKQLEAGLEVSLFIREKNRLYITPEGEHLLRYANRILALIDEAQTSLRDKNPVGPLRIGAMETTAATRLPPLLAQFHRHMPSVELHLNTSASGPLTAQVLNSELDVAFVAENDGIRHDLLNSAVLCRETLVLVTAAGHPDVLTGADLQVTNPLAFRQGCNYRLRLEHWLWEQGISEAAPQEFGSFQAILGCVAAGMGIALLPENVVCQYEQGFSIRSHGITPAIGEVDTLMIWLKSRETSRVLRCFKDFVSEQN